VAKLWPFLYIQDGRQDGHVPWILSIANSAILSAVPDNPSLEPNLEWIGCTICEIFAFYTVTLKLGFGVAQGHRNGTIRYSTCDFICVFYSRILLEKSLPLVFGAPVRVKPSDLRNNPWWRKTRMMGLSDSERISMICSAILIQSTRVTDVQTDRQTDGRNCRSIYAL